MVLRFFSSSNLSDLADLCIYRRMIDIPECGKVGASYILGFDIGPPMELGDLSWAWDGMG